MDTTTRRKTLNINDDTTTKPPLPPTDDNIIIDNINKDSSVPLPLSNNDDDNKVTFITNAHDYLNIMKDIQNITKGKQEALASMDRSQLIKIDKDPDESVGTKLPKWLSLLLEKYKSYAQTNNKPTLGKFSAFLSCCVLGQISSSSDELEALSSLLHASNDTMVHYDDNQSSSSLLLLSSQTYVSKRLYNFISSLTELKSYIKDEQNIENFSIV